LSGCLRKLKPHGKFKGRMDERGPGRWHGNPETVLVIANRERQSGIKFS
jgi:hypothetical protein